MHPDVVGWRESRQIMESLKYSIKNEEVKSFTRDLSTIQIVEIFIIQMYLSNKMDTGASRKTLLSGADF